MRWYTWSIVYNGLDVYNHSNKNGGDRLSSIWISLVYTKEKFYSRPLPWSTSVLKYTLRHPQKRVIVLNEIKPVLRTYQEVLRSSSSLWLAGSHFSGRKTKVQRCHELPRVRNLFPTHIPFFFVFGVVQIYLLIFFRVWNVSNRSFSLLLLRWNCFPRRFEIWRFKIWGTTILFPQHSEKK